MADHLAGEQWRELARELQKGTADGHTERSELDPAGGQLIVVRDWGKKSRVAD